MSTSLLRFLDFIRGKGFEALVIPDSKSYGYSYLSVWRMGDGHQVARVRVNQYSTIGELVADTPGDLGNRWFEYLTVANWVGYWNGKMVREYQRSVDAGE